MAITSGMFMSVNGDRKYKAWWFARYFALFIGNGVFPNPSTGLQVINGDLMTTKVKPGDGWINGYFIVNDSDYILQHDVADGVLKRIDRVVMRLTFVDREIEIVIKKGIPSSTPTAPILQRDSEIYELALADVLISNGVTAIAQGSITDLRLNKELCGIVHGTVDQVDTTTIFNQYMAWFEQMKVTAGTTMDDWQAATELEFQTWFDSVKGLLDGDIAANLASRITTLELNTVTKQELITLKKDIFQSGYSVYRDSPDDNGVFRLVTYKRKSDGTTAATATLSGGTSPMYTTRTVQYHDELGNPTDNIEIYSLTYTEDGSLKWEV